MSRELAADSDARGTIAPIIEFRHLSKAFGGVQALDDVDLSVRAGEIHGLLGQNGSGKSTLIKILAGYHEPEHESELLVRGRAVRLPLRMGEFREHGIGFVHQELGLVESLTVLDNLRVGCYQPGRFGRISWGLERKLAREALGRLDLKLDLDTQVGNLRDIDRALLAIVRAVMDVEASGETGLLVLDEPTVYLPRNSVDRLFEVMRRVANRGNAVLFVSHQLREVLAITDRATVLRDGKLTGTVVTGEVDEARLVEMIVGRAVVGHHPEHTATGADDACLSVTNLSGGAVNDLSLALRKGEVVGLTGLVGMGFEDVPGLLYGSIPARAGQVLIRGRRYEVARLSPESNRSAGVALVPANRLRHAIVTALTVGDNVTLPILGKFFRGFRLRLGEIRSAAFEVLNEFGVRPSDPDRRMGTLSGGNQQKTVLAKWLQTKPEVLLLHEPTQGVDVGARQDIYRIILEVAEGGAGILVASSEYDDLENTCSRVLIFNDGRVARELTGDNLTADDILEACFKASSDLARV